MNDARAAESLLARARALAQGGRMAEAERAYAAVLAQAPQAAEALNFLGVCALARGQHTHALELLQRALAVDADNAETQANLARVYAARGDLAAALSAYDRAVTLEPVYLIAWLERGRLLEKQGQRRLAVTSYLRAITQAQAHGQWVSESTTPAPLRAAVLHAIRYAWEGRRALFATVLSQLRNQFGAGEIVRIEQGLRFHFGEAQPAFPDPRQQPTFFYVPGLPAQPYLDRALLPWLDELEAHTTVLRAELDAVLAAAQPLESFLRHHTVEETAAYLGGSADAQWNAYFFHRHGERYDEHCGRCPRTATLLDTLPLARIREHAPEALFSVLSPGAHILPHRGVTNARLVAHLPLIVPPHCALRVGGEEHVWQEGRAVVFDDTYEHEAWNRSERTRVVLILDVWNPHLREGERAALAELIAVLGDFNREAGVSDRV
jgi:aspartate beta-hydroxylase